MEEDKREEPEEPDLEFQVGPVYGFKAFAARHSDRKGHHLVAPFRGTKIDLYDWSEDLVAPEWDGLDGFNAFRDLRNCFSYVQASTSFAKQSSTFIFARVELGGVVIEHEVGYRAQRQRIMDLYAGPGRSACRRLEQNLGWPFEVQQMPPHWYRFATSERVYKKQPGPIPSKRLIYGEERILYLDDIKDAYAKYGDFRLHLANTETEFTAREVLEDIYGVTDS